MSNTEPNPKGWSLTLFVGLLVGLSCCFLFVWPTTGLAQDSSPVLQERTFDPERLERFRNNPDYNYERAVPEQPTPPEKDDSPEIDNISSPNIPGGAALGALAQGLIWVLIIGGTLFALAQLLKVRMGRLVNKESDEANAMNELEGEDINQMDFDDPIQDAINQGHFRRATRLLYLRSLKQLQQRSLIEWKREKTNQQYLRELKVNDLYTVFRETTFLFEYIWYGEFPVDRNHFNNAHATFLRFDQALRRYDEK